MSLHTSPMVSMTHSNMARPFSESRSALPITSNKPLTMLLLVHLYSWHLASRSRPSVVVLRSVLSAPKVTA